MTTVRFKFDNTINSTIESRFSKLHGDVSKEVTIAIDIEKDLNDIKHVSDIEDILKTYLANTDTAVYREESATYASNPTKDIDLRIHDMVVSKTTLENIVNDITRIVDGE